MRNHPIPPVPGDIRERVLAIDLASTGPGQLVYTHLQLVYELPQQAYNKPST